MKFLCFADVLQYLKETFWPVWYSIYLTGNSELFSISDLSGLLSLPPLWNRICHFSFSQ